MIKGFLRRFVLKKIADASVPTPPAGEIAVFASDDDNTVKAKKSDGSIVDLEDAGSGSPAARQTGQITTASLADLAVENGSISLCKIGVLVSIEIDRAARVRLYATAAARTADAARAFESAAHDGDCLVDLQETAADLYPAPAGTIIYNLDTPTVSDSIYYAVQNRSGATSAVIVDITHLDLE
jgi:hypothetical protein